MDKKILFFDIDGTILSYSTYALSDSTKNAIQQAQANGHLAFINTGRVISAIPDFVKEIGFDGYVCGCGTHVSYHGQVLLQNFVPKKLTRMLIKDLRFHGIDAVLEGSTAVYYDDNVTNPIIKEVRDYHVENGFAVGSWDDPSIVIDKFCIWTINENASKEFREKYREHFDFIDRNHHLYEIIPKGHSKATGIQYLEEHLGIAHENTYAFGDGENDLPMLTYANHTIAMGNAPQSIKDIVSFVTEDVDENGIAHALKHFGLI